MSAGAFSGPQIERLIQALSKLPGLGPRSARRAALQLIKKKEKLLLPLLEAIHDVAESIVECHQCGNLDVTDPCLICADERRDSSLLVVVEDVADLWALERARVTRGRFHVLGGRLSPLDGIGPDDLNIAKLIERAQSVPVKEVLLATNATVDGQATAHYIMDQLSGLDLVVSKLAHGVPVGGELDFLDDGTLAAAIRQRQPF